MQFQYVSAATPNRNAYIFDDDANEGNDAAQSDIVRLVLNQAFIKDPKQFKFTTEYLIELQNNSNEKKIAI